MQKWCEIFKTGEHTSSNGLTKVWTDEDLDEIVKKFNEQKPDVPIVIGHPKESSPAYGWVDAVKKEGDKLLAAFKQVNEDFADWVKKGLYKTRSISLYPDLSLRHIGFLGAVPPAIKGLKEFQFSDYTQSYCVTAAVSNPFDNVVHNCNEPADENELLCSSRSRSSNNPNAAAFFNENNEKGGNMTDINENFASEANEETPSNEPEIDFSEQLKQKDARIKELEEQAEKTAKAQRKTEHIQFCENLLKEGNITPAQKNDVIDFMEVCELQKTFDFSEGGDKDVLTRFKSFLNSIKQVDFSEIATEKNAKETKTSSVDFTDGKAIADAIIERKALYESQGRKIAENVILKELKKEGEI